MKIITVYSNFKNQGGAQNMALLLAQSLNKDVPVVLTCTPLEEIDCCYKSMGFIFEPFNMMTVWKYRSALFLSHSRNTTTFLCFINSLLFHSIRIIHVAHSIFLNLKLFSLFPLNIIAVSNGVKKNLIDYFEIPADRIKVIFNGLEDKYDSSMQKDHVGSIVKVIFAGRVCKVKRQLEFVLKMKNKLDERIQIYFAGVGEDMEQLEKAVENNSQFHILGQIDIMKELYFFDYMLLFSEKEGLPVTLIEGCMFAKPLITNNILSVLDLNENGYNGFVYKNWEDLLVGLNQLPSCNEEEYKKLSFNSRQMYLSKFRLSYMIEEYKRYIVNCYGK